MSWLSRIGLAIVRPARALELAGARGNAGRSGSDLLLALAIAVVATRLRGLVAAGWLGAVLGWGLGARAAVHVLTGALAIDLGLLVIAALVVWAGSGPRRELGRAFDLACVAALPLVAVDLVAGVVAPALPPIASYVVTCLACGWMFSLVMLAIAHARRMVAAPPREADVRRARLAGLAVVLVAVAGAALQVAAVVREPATIRPMTTGARAPAFGLHRIGPGGALGAPLTLADVHGKTVVIDFWATWCGPCRASLPRMDALARRHPEALFVAVDLSTEDDPAAARAMFDAHHWAMTLVADDGTTSERYGVTTIPHTVVVDRTGVVTRVFRGGGLDVDAAIEALLH